MAVDVKITGIDECLAAFQSLEKELRREANGELRQASMQIAKASIGMLGGSPAPQEAAVIASLGAKRDRMVVVAVVRKPKLSGLKNTPAAVAKGAVIWPIELGSSAPQFRGPQQGAIVARHRDRIARYAIPLYRDAINSIMRRYELT